jgi:hypothetical protein
MLNPKVKLADLKVKSFVSALDSKPNVMGSFSVLQSRRNSINKYTWKVTVVDTLA